MYRYGVCTYTYFDTAHLKALFPTSCRDRSRIKKRKAVKEREKRENGHTDAQHDVGIEVTQSSASYQSQNNPPSMDGNHTHYNGITATDGSVEHLDLSVYTIETGVDNLTFKYSNTNIKFGDEKCRPISQKSKTTADIVSFRPNRVSKRANSHDACTHPDRNLGHLPADCLAVKKTVRRHSYEVAVCEYSWLPAESPGVVTTSQTTMDTCNYRVNTSNGVKLSTAVFENKAYDKDDYKKT